MWMKLITSFIYTSRLKTHLFIFSPNQPFLTFSELFITLRFSFNAVSNATRAMCMPVICESSACLCSSIVLIVCIQMLSMLICCNKSRNRMSAAGLMRSAISVQRQTGSAWMLFQSILLFLTIISPTWHSSLIWPQSCFPAALTSGFCFCFLNVSSRKWSCLTCWSTKSQKKSENVNVESVHAVVSVCT